MFISFRSNHSDWQDHSHSGNICQTNDYSVAVKIVGEFFFTWKNVYDVNLSEKRSKEYDPYYIKMQVHTTDSRRGKRHIVNSSLFLDCKFISN